MTLADIKAIYDVLDEFLENVDSLNAKEAILARIEVEKVRRRAADVEAFLTTRALTVLEGQPIKVDGKMYVPRSTGKWRPDHAVIKSKVIANAVVTDDGEVVADPVQAAANAAELMHTLFVSPSSMPKSGQVESKLHASFRDIATYEHTGSELKVMDLKEVEE